MSASDFLAEARASLQRKAYNLALAELETEFPTCTENPQLCEIVAAVVCSLVSFGQCEARKLGRYAAMRGRAYLSEQAHLESTLQTADGDFGQSHKD